MKTLEELTQSGLLKSYVEGTASETERREVESAAAIDPAVAKALDSLLRAKVDGTIEKFSHADPQPLIESGDLEAYANGEYHGPEFAQTRLEIELMAFLHPSVMEELKAIEAITESLANRSNLVPPTALKAKIFQAIDAVSEGGVLDEANPPILSSISTAKDYADIIDKGQGLVPPHYENTFVVPMSFAPEALTLFVCVKDFIEEETHLDSIEKFLVLEGGCRIVMGDSEVYLKAGDYLSIPKFTRHTVFVTSSIPCKLIVQQVAA
jgi:mannose-6-phosphate isomerase-like protein (cupin superfamily)